MTDTVRNERAAIQRYFLKHFGASPPVDHYWYEKELKDLASLVRHDPEIGTYAEWQQRDKRYTYRSNSYPIPD